MKFILDFRGIIPNISGIWGKWGNWGNGKPGEISPDVEEFYSPPSGIYSQRSGIYSPPSEFIPNSRINWELFGNLYTGLGIYSNSRKFILDLLGNLFSTLGSYSPLKFNLLYYFCFIQDRTSDSELIQNRTSALA